MTGEPPCKPVSALGPFWRASPRLMTAALILIAFGGWVLRAAPLLRAGGPLAHPIDYDEGVYFAASALLTKGVLPYRDFVFVHPPGLLYVLGLASAFVASLGAAEAFAAARFLATAIGAINVFLVGRLATRWSGAIAGLVAAALYASYPEAVGVERGPFLEPVLNLACLAMALAWLGEPSRSGAWRRPLIAGALCGVALAVKVLGCIWFLPAVLTLPPGRRRVEALCFFLGAAAAVWAALVLPIAGASPAEFLTDTLFFHAWRPPDGDVDRLLRLGTIVGGSHAVASALALVGLGVGMGSTLLRSARDFRFFAGVYLLTLAVFLTSSAYWSQYNAHLAASEAVLAGFGAAALWRLARSKISRLERTPTWVLPLAVVLIAFPSVRRSILSARSRAPDQVALGKTIAQMVSPGDCLFSFEPAWAIAGGRLPQRVGTAPLLVDSYGAMLLDAVRAGARFPDANTAFQSASSQTQVSSLLQSCRFVVLGWRGAWQLSDETKAWFRTQFVRRYPPEGVEGIDLWEQNVTNSSPSP